MIVLFLLKAADQPYTYRFILSEKTLLYLPTQEELLKYKATEKSVRRECQRPKSLPDFLSVFSTMMERCKESMTVDVPASIDSAMSPSDSDRLFVLKKDSRERTGSLPPKLMFNRQDSDGSSWITSTDSSSDAPLSPKDDLKDFSWVDSVDAFSFRERGAPQKVPITACFKPGDLPLLNFQDLLNLDGDTGHDCCSPLSIESSERSYEYELCEDTSFWISKMDENPDLKFSLGMEEVPRCEIEGRVPEPSANENNGDSSMDIDTEMDIVQEIIDLS